MTRQEHLLTIAMEECNEVAQRLSKALRFGLGEVQPGQPFDNRERIRYEFSHLCAAMEMIDPSTPNGGHVYPPNGKTMDEKREQVKRFLAYSEQCGTLAASEGQEPPAQTSPLEQLLIDVYQMAKEQWCAQCYGFTGAPETVKRGAHESAREGFDAICKKLGSVVHPLLKAEWDEATRQAKASSALVERTHGETK